MRIRDGNVLEIDRYDTIGYYDSMKTIKTGTMVVVDKKKYRVLSLNKVELAFGGNRFYLNVEEVVK